MDEFYPIAATTGRQFIGLKVRAILISGALGKLKVGGEIRGTADDPVTIAAGGRPPRGSSSTIGIASLQVGGGVTQARILAGYDKFLQAKNADAVIGSVTIGGDWIASSLVAGVAAAADTFFGTADDALISGSGTTNDANLTSHIASILLKGQLLGTLDGADAFGFVAEQIGKLKVGAVAYPLTGAPNEIIALGTTGDFNAREDV